jgi:hypothetical protein
MALEYVFNPLPQNTGGFIVWELPQYQSRDEGVIASGSGILKAGTILGILTATGEYGPYTPGATNGLQTAAAVLYDDCDATSAAVKRTVLNNTCQLHRAEIVFTGTPTTTQKNAAYASLRTLGIKMR